MDFFKEASIGCGSALLKKLPIRAELVKPHLWEKLPKDW
jgi:hypothetical protein